MLGSLPLGMLSMAARKEGIGKACLSRDKLFNAQKYTHEKQASSIIRYAGVIWFAFHGLQLLVIQ